MIDKELGIRMNGLDDFLLKHLGCLYPAFLPTSRPMLHCSRT
jgi:hypothetical protein